MSKIKKIISAFLCLSLLISAALLTVGCKKGSDVSDTESVHTVRVTEIGEGDKYFTFTVEADGEKKVYNVKTDKKTVGEALLENELISGEDGAYGLYVKKVDGISADYEKDGAYWSFYENGKYANSGVDTTDIKVGGDYAFKKEKS